MPPSLENWQKIEADVKENKLTHAQIADKNGMKVAAVEFALYKYGKEYVGQVHYRRLDYTKVDELIGQGVAPHEIVLLTGYKRETIMARKRKLKTGQISRVESHNPFYLHGPGEVLRRSAEVHRRREREKLEDYRRIYGAGSLTL